MPYNPKNMMSGINLTKQQLEAVNHGEGPLLIVAGAGTGKTLVVTHRIAQLINNKLAKPEEIYKVLCVIWDTGGLLYIIFSILIFIIAISIYSIRWKILVKEHALKISIFRLFNFYLLGQVNFYQSNINI